MSTNPTLECCRRYSFADDLVEWLAACMCDDSLCASQSVFASLSRRGNKHQVWILFLTRHPFHANISKYLACFWGELARAGSKCPNAQTNNRKRTAWLKRWVLVITVLGMQSVAKCMQIGGPVRVPFDSYGFARWLSLSSFAKETFCSWFYLGDCTVLHEDMNSFTSL